VTRGYITSVVAVGSLALVFAGEATAAPTAAFTADPPSPVVVGQQVTFDPSTSTPSPPANPGDPAPVIRSVEWDLNGDGTFETPGAPDTPVTQPFESESCAQVSLQVTDDTGEQDTATQQIVVNPAANPRTPPVASFTVTAGPAVAPWAATFTSTSDTPVPGCSIQSTEWDFDNGRFTTSGLTASYTFPSGPHSIRLSVVDSRGVPAQTVLPVDVNARPVARFIANPESPLVGETVNLISSSFDPEGEEPEHLWDLDRDGAYDDASGREVKGVFLDAGNHTVKLLVRDSADATSTFSKDINVRPSPTLQPIPNQPPAGSNNPTSKGNPAPTTTTQQPFLRLLTPFPVVRLQGAVAQRGTRIRRLTVRAPKGSRVLVFCRGKRCPAKRLTKVANGRTLRFRALERVLPVRSLVQVFVRRGEQIGKYTSFLMRRKRVPKRIDGCLLPSSPRAVTCPED
jgi:PKD repeat protein